MGRPNDCNCFCVEPPCEEGDSINKCWAPTVCTGDDPFEDFSEEFKDKYEFIIVIQAEYRYRHELVRKSGFDEFILADIPIEDPDNDGERLIILATDLSIVGEALRYLRQCANISVSGERIEIDKAEIKKGYTYTHKAYTDPETSDWADGIELRSPIHTFVYSLLKSKIVSSGSYFFDANQKCQPKCLTEEDIQQIIDSDGEDFYEGIYGTRELQANVRYCGFDPDGVFYTEKTLESAQLSLGGSVGDFQYNFSGSSTIAAGAVGGCPEVTLPYSQELKIEFGGQGFSGTYPAVPTLSPFAGRNIPINPAPFDCPGSGWSYPVPPIAISGYLKRLSRIWQGTFGCDKICPKNVEYEIPYIGYAWISIQGASPEPFIDSKIQARVSAVLYRNISSDLSIYQGANFFDWLDDYCKTEEDMITHNINVSPVTLALDIFNKPSYIDDACECLNNKESYLDNGPNYRFRLYDSGNLPFTYNVPTNGGDNIFIPFTNTNLTLAELQSPFFSSAHIGSYYGCCPTPLPLDANNDQALYTSLNCSRVFNPGMVQHGEVTESVSLGTTQISASTKHTTSGGRDN